MTKKFILLVLLFTVIGIIYSYPLIRNFKSAIPYSYSPQRNYETTVFIQGDHFQLFYSLWLFKDYFVSKGQRFFEEPYQFKVKNHPRSYTTREFPLSIVFCLFSWLGNVPAYNCLIILSFVLSGICMFLLAEKYLHSFSASLVAACIFSIIPFRLAHLFGGHPSGFLVFWLPLIIYTYELLWERKKWIYGWLSGLFIFLMIIEEPHLGYYSALFTVVFWGYKIFFSAFSAKKTSWQRIIKLSVPIVVSWLLVALYMFFIKQMVLSVSIAGGGRGIEEIKLYAPSLKDIFRRVNMVSEKYIYIGTVTGVLLSYTIFLKLYRRLKKRDRNDDFPFLFYFGTFITALVLSLGPNLRGLPVYKLCYKIIPFFSFPRSPGRISIFSSLALSILIGYGIKLMLQNKKKIFKSAITLCLLSLICIDFKTCPAIGLSRTIKENKAYQFVKASFPRGPILKIPIWPGDSSWSSIYEFFTTLYQIPMLNGYCALVSNRYVNEIFWPLVSINMGILTKEQYRVLTSLGVKYVFLHEEAYPAKVSPFPFKIALKNLKKNPYVKFVMDDGQIYLFEVLDGLTAISPPLYRTEAKTGLFYECERLPHHSMGKLVKDKEAHIGTALFIEPPVNQPSCLVFGPWKLFPPGKYKVIFRLKGFQERGPLARVEVTTDKGKEKIAYKDIKSSQIKEGYKDYQLNFALDKTIRLEFRVFYYGQGRLWADYIYILCQEEEDPCWQFEAEDLYHIGQEIYDKEASAEAAVYVSPGCDPAANIVFGPYRRYPAGEYNIGFRLKIPEKIDKPVCVLKITPANSRLSLTKKILRGRDFLSKDNYQEYCLPIKLDKPGVLEFKVDFKGKAPVYIDEVRIKTKTREE